MSQIDLVEAQSLGEIKAKPVPFQAWIVVAYSSEKQGRWKVFEGFWTNQEGAIARARGLSGHWTKRYVFELNNGEKAEPMLVLPPK